MAEHPLACLKQEEWGKLWAILSTHTLHVIEGDKSGGFRDRLLSLELDYKAFKIRFWYGSIIGGIIGALIGAGASDILVVFVKWIMKI